MAPLVKLVIIFKMDWDACLVGKSACLSSSSLHSSKEQPYLVSTSCFKVSLITFINYVCLILISFTKIK